MVRTPLYNRQRFGQATVMILMTVACVIPDQPGEPEVPSMTGTTSSDVPQFRVDPFWASELPNNWILGQVSGLAVDNQDHVWIVHRPRTLDARQRGEEGMCLSLIHI